MHIASALLCARLQLIFSLGGPSLQSTVAATSTEANRETENPSPAARADAAPASKAEELPIGLWGRPVKRGGFHFQFGLGVGGGPDTLGILQVMEVGYSWKHFTIALLHTFIQNKGVLGTDLGGPDLIGGWMFEYKHTLFYPDLVWKVAVGLGGTHDQTSGIHAHGGLGLAYGLDLHLPVWRSVGPTWGLTAMNVTAEGKHHFGAGLTLGVTVF